MPASEFFREYLTRLQARFAGFRQATVPLHPPTSADTGMLNLPVTVRIPSGKAHQSVDVSDAELFRVIREEERLLLLVGPPGSGKSNLCARVMSRLAETALLPG